MKILVLSFLVCLATPAAVLAGGNPASVSNGAAASAPPLTADSVYQLEGNFVSDGGAAFPLSSLRGRPVVLALFFTSCGYACPVIVGDMEAVRRKFPAEQAARAAFVLISFDSDRDVPATLARYRALHGLDDHWVLLHADADSVRALAVLLGVKYRRADDGMYAHSNLITVLNAEGEIVYQRHGLSGGLDETARAVGQAEK